MTSAVSTTIEDDKELGEPRLYEFCILYPYPMGQKEEGLLLKEIEKLFEEAGAKHVAKDPWGRRGLAFPIGGFTEGTFVVFYYQIEPKQIRELDRALRITKGVLRHMIVKPPKGYEIVPYAPKFDQWMKERVSVDEARVRAKEAKIQKQLTDKAKRQVKRAEERKKEVVVEKKPKLEGEALSAELDKIISDDLNI